MQINACINARSPLLQINLFELFSQSCLESVLKTFSNCLTAIAHKNICFLLLFLLCKICLWTFFTAFSKQKIKAVQFDIQIDLLACCLLTLDSLLLPLLVGVAFVPAAVVDFIVQPCLHGKSVRSKAAVASLLSHFSAYLLFVSLPSMESLGISFFFFLFFCL